MQPKRAHTRTSCNTAPSVPAVWDFYAKFRVGDVNIDPLGPWEYAIADQQGQFDWGVDSSGNLNSAWTDISLEIDSDGTVTFSVGSNNGLTTSFVFNSIIGFVLQSAVLQGGLTLDWQNIQVSVNGSATSDNVTCLPNVSSREDGHKPPSTRGIDCVQSAVEVDLPDGTTSVTLTAQVHLAGPNASQMGTDDIVGLIYVYSDTHPSSLRKARRARAD